MIENAVFKVVIAAKETGMIHFLYELHEYHPVGLPAVWEFFFDNTGKLNEDYGLDVGVFICDLHYNESQFWNGEAWDFDIEYHFENFERIVIVC